MKKLLFIALIAALAVPALAINTVILDGFPGSTAQLYTDGSPDGSPFVTFCVEDDRTFAPNGSNVYEYTIDTEVYYGGTVGNTTPATLTDTTKKLYSAFLNGALAGGTSATTIQNAIWDSQAGITAPALGLLGTLGDDDAGYGRWGDVKVLNLWTVGYAYDTTTDNDGNYIYDQQSQLIRVPVPGAFLLGGLGTVCVGWLKRRRSL